MKTTITISDGTVLTMFFSVLETIAYNGYTNGMLLRYGHGSARNKDGNGVTFTYVRQ